jgi:hypothetical protein
MKKLVLFVNVFLISLISYGSDDCNANLCPGSGQMCCQESVSVAWGLYEYDVTHYSNVSDPVDEVCLINTCEG